MNESSKDKAMNTAQRIACGLFLAAILFSVNSIGASLFGESAKSAPRVSEKLAGKLIITGASTMTPMTREIAKRFEALHPGTQIEVSNVGASQGIIDVREGKSSIAMVTRALTDKESDLTSYPVARDGICVIVHKDSPITTLTRQQVADIFEGKIVNWNKVGGRDATIDVVNGVKGSGSAEPFIQYFKIKYDEIKPMAVLLDGGERIKIVAGSQNAISFASLGEAARKIKSGVPIKMLPAEGVSATAKALRSGNFPIARPLTLVTTGRQNELAKTFIRYALSSNVTDIIGMYDFVPYAD